MAFWGDYHTHTTYSHGSGSVLDNARAAKEKGLKQIAITDHGLRHIVFGIRRRQLPSLRRDCDQATEITGVLTLAGIENNVYDFDGLFDCKQKDLEMLDIVQGGFHKAVWSKNIIRQFTFQFRNMYMNLFSKSPKKLVVKNTDAYLKLIDNYELDFIGHINRDIRVDIPTVARYAKQKGTYIELNSKQLTLKKPGITDADIEKMAQDGVEFVCNSDAHSPSRVGDMAAALNVIERLHIPFSQIANWEKFPSFRSGNYRRAIEAASVPSGADKPDSEVKS